MKQRITETVNLHDTDPDGIARPSAVLRLLADAANEQMRVHGMPPDTLLRDTGRAFLLGSVHVELLSPLHAYEQIDAEAWACESRGFRFLRCGQLLREGECVAQMSAVWAFVQAADRTLLPVTAFDNPFGTEAPLSLDFPLRDRTPKDLDYTCVGSYEVRYRDVDLHRHVNNTNYPDLLYGFLPDTRGARLRAMTIFFQKEAPLGERLAVYHAARDGVHYLKTVRQDGCDNVHAALRLCAL